MYNPLVLFSKALLDAFIKAGKTHYVRQTYTRGLNPHDDKVKAAFLFTHYDDASKASMHYNAIKGDPNSFLYDIKNEEHLKKLKIAASQPAGFLVYAALMKDAWKPGEQIANQLKKYIDYHLHWKPGRNDQVGTDLFLQFGTLFITLKWKDNQVKVPFSDIERA